MTAFLVILAFGYFGSDAQGGSVESSRIFHGFSAPNPNGTCYSPGAFEKMGDRVSGEIGADTLRLHCYWNEYETGPNQYNQSFLTGLLDRVRTAQGASGNANIRVLVNLDLSGDIAWMHTPYALESMGSETPGQVARYFPTSAAGLEAYGRAMAKILKYLHVAGVSAFIETPNESNFGGPASQIPAEKVGQMAGQAVSFAAAEGLQLNSQTGPAILTPAMLINEDPGKPESLNKKQNIIFKNWTTKTWESGNDTTYFWEVQHMTDYTIEQWWKSIPGGPSFASTLKGTWRPSFHAYPELAKPTSVCAGWPSNLEDQKGDRSGEAAWLTVKDKLTPLLSVIENGKRWWLTETGFTSYKTNESSENENNCLNRRIAGGSTYGKNQQADFYKRVAEFFNKATTAPWNRIEGVTFFLPLDCGIQGNPPHGGMAVYQTTNLGECGTAYPSKKTAAVTFNQRFGSAEALPPAGWFKENLGGNSGCAGAGAAPAISSWGPGRLDLFVCGADSALWHRWWNDEVGWSAWESLGGYLTSPPSAVSWGPNRLDVVARGSYNHPWHWAWNGSSWSAEDLGGEIQNAPAVSSRGVGKLDVFARGMDNALWIKSLYPGTGWTTWNNIGGSINSAPSSVSWGPERIDVVARAPYGEYWHWAWNGSTWTSENIYGVFESPPAVASRGFAQLDVYGRGSDNALWHKALVPGTGWTGWGSMGGALTSGPAAVAWGPNRMDIVTSSESNTVTHWFWGK